MALLKDELVENILEITISAESKEYFNLLKRIERSVDQYVKRDKNLFYIGFLGHYSSGKSSTINSILKANGSKSERPVNINPTDDQITLITSPENSDTIVKLIRVGQVPVVLSPVDNVDFLNDKIIMDTPGFGDPSLVEEIVRDSLPLCDLLIYCISAANPLDTSDIPLLIEKERNLIQIPTIYVITRGNEFKKNHLSELTPENFDESEARLALSELASRMNEIVDTIKLDFSDFIVIDNKERYNIAKLIDAIVCHTNRADQENILNLHSHKVDFFVRVSSKIKDHFDNLILDKLNTMESFVTKAQNNIDEYNQKTSIGIDKLVNEWRISDDRIKQIVDGSVSENNRLYQTLETPPILQGLPSVETWIENTKSSIKQASQIISDDGKSLLSNRLYDLKEKYKEKLYSFAGRDGSISKTEIASFLSSVKIDLPVTINTAFNYTHEFNSLYDSTLNYLTSQRYDILKRAFDSVLQRARNKNPLDNIGKHIEDAKTTMSSIFETYNEAVRIYRVAAFSSEAKNYIKKLGLSAKLDKLDTEGINIQDYYSRAQHEILGKYYEEIATFKDGCSKVEQLISESNIDHPIITSHNKEIEIQSLSLNFLSETKSAIDEKLKEILLRVNEQFVDLIDVLNLERSKFSARKQIDLKTLRNARVKFYLIRYIPTFLVVAFTISLFQFPTWFSFLDSDLSIGWQWTLGILSNIAFAALSTIFIKAKDRYPDKQLEVSLKYTKDEKQLIAETIDKAYNDFYGDFVSAFKSHIQAWVNEKSIKILTELLSDKYSDNLHKSHKVIFESEKKVKFAIEYYSSILNNLKSAISSILNNSKLNKDVVTKQANLIKQNSISPSFDLLFKTKNDILKIKDTFSKVDFQGLS